MLCKADTLHFESQAEFQQILICVATPKRISTRADADWTACWKWPYQLSCYCGTAPACLEHRRCRSLSLLDVQLPSCFRWKSLHSKWQQGYHSITSTMTNPFTSGCPPKAKPKHPGPPAVHTSLTCFSVPRFGHSFMVHVPNHLRSIGLASSKRQHKKRGNALSIHKSTGTHPLAWKQWFFLWIYDHLLS